MIQFEKEEDRSSKAITKILRQTLEGEILWKIDNGRPNNLGAEEYVIGHVYKTDVLDKHLRLYKYKSKFFTDYLEYTMIEGIKLQFVDNNDNPEWEFPYSNAVDDLYRAISYQTSEVKDFFEKLLGD